MGMWIKNKGPTSFNSIHLHLADTCWAVKLQDVNIYYYQIHNILLE